MRLEDIAASISVDPEREKAYAKEMCRNLHGRVRKSPGIRFGVMGLLCIFLLRMIGVCTINPGFGSMLLMIAGLLGGALVLWYTWSWELTFDGETGFFSYHTLIKGTIRFHVSDINEFSTNTTRRGRRSRMTLVDTLVIRVGDTTICVVTKQERVSKVVPSIGSGYTDGNKLLQYLELYQKCIASPAEGLAMTGVDPRIAAAIAEEKRKEAAPETAKLPEQTGEKAQEAEETAEPVPEPEVQPASEQKKPASPAPSAPEPKQTVDVDALFNNVLKQYGKK